MASGMMNLNTYKAILLAKQPTLTIGATGKTFDGTVGVSFSKDEILGGSGTATFLRADKTWTNTITLASGSSGEFRAARGSIAVWMGIGSGNENHGLYSEKKADWIIYCNASGSVQVNGNSATATILQTTRNFTIGATAKSFNGSAAVSWTMNEIMGSSDSTKFYRGDKVWSNILEGTLNISYNNRLVFYGKNNNTSPHASMGFINELSGGKMHCYNNGNSYQTSGAFYIWSNGCDAGTDNGGIAIDNEGVTVFGAGDEGTNFTGIFRVINEDDINTGPRFLVKKEGACYFGKGLGYYISNDGSQYTGSAAKWTTARTITLTGATTGSVSIDGSSNVSLATTNVYLSHSGKAEDECIPSVADAFQSFRATNSSTGFGDGYIAAWRWSSGTYYTQLFADVDKNYALLYRYHANGGAWSSWKRIPMGDGTGASGTWGISITGSSASCTGNAATATTASSCSGNAATATHATTFGSAAACKVYFHNSDECNFGGTNTSANLYFNYRATGDGRPIPTNFVFGGSGGSATIKAGKVLNAVWNDFAEFREADTDEPGRVVIPTNNGVATKSIDRLQPNGRIISDTYGCAVGESETARTPLGMAGRVLVYPYRPIEEYQIGDCVCTAPNGTVDIMTREEIKEWPDRIIGIVNEIPSYEIWEQKLIGHDTNKPDAAEYATIQRINVNGRIWIDIK